MSKTSLNKVIGKRALTQHVPGDQWPIPEQFVGLEIEMENSSRVEQTNHITNGGPFWEAHQDGSLRNGIEYVLAEPLMGSQLSRAISYFFNTFKNYTISPRTSIHVHINMRQDEDSVEGLKNLLVLYYMYEEAIFKYADINRKWCAYCNPCEDNPPQILIDVLKFDPNVPAQVGWLGRQLQHFAGTNTNRYYGLNIAGLQRFGTLEFRHFPLVKDEAALTEWISFIMELKLAARKLADEGKVVSEFITSADDIQSLAPYFPRFWHKLNGVTTPREAYIRMLSVMGLVIAQQEYYGEGMEGNPAWTRFLNEQKGRGKEVLAQDVKVVADKRPRIPQPQVAPQLAERWRPTWEALPGRVVEEPEPDVMDMFEEVRFAEQQAQINQAVERFEMPNPLIPRALAAPRPRARVRTLADIRRDDEERRRQMHAAAERTARNNLINNNRG